MLDVLALVIGLAAGVIVQQTMGGDLLVILYVTLLVIGIYLLISVPFAGKESDYVPSQRSFRLVWGTLITLAGALLLINEYVSQEWYIYVVMVLIVIALLIAAQYLSASKEEEK